ncbi:MAG: antitoxin [Solirubrobacteraceae bacterium]
MEKAVEKAEALADRQTQGKYTDQIHEAGAKADAYVETLQTPGPPQDDAPAPPTPGSETPDRPSSA